MLRNREKESTPPLRDDFDRLLQEHECLIDVYEAVVWNAEYCSGAAGERVVGVLISAFDVNQLSAIETSIHNIPEFADVRVCWSDPSIHPRLDDPSDTKPHTIDDEQRQRLLQTWKVVFPERMRLLEIPDVNGVSMEWRGDAPILVIFVMSLAFRPVDAPPIPTRLDELTVVVRVASFRYRSLRTRTCTYQRLYCEATGQQFSLGGLVRNGDDTFAISCAHSLPLDEKHDRPINVFKLEQTVVNAGKTAHEHEVHDFKVHSRPVEHDFLPNETEHFYSDSNPFGIVDWHTIGNVPFDHIPFLKDAELHGIDASLIRLCTKHVTLHSHRQHAKVPLSGRFAEPEFGDEHFTIGSKHHMMVGIAYPIDVHIRQKLTQRCIVLFNQVAVHIKPESCRVTYHDTTDNGNSGAWIYNTHGDAVGIYSAGTGVEASTTIVVATPLLNVIRHIKTSVNGWENWVPEFLLPQEPAV